MVLCGFMSNRAEDAKLGDAIRLLRANGKKVVRCVEDPKAALQQTPPAPQREDR